MLSKQRFKRLTIVLVAPLLALGWWLASSDVLFPNSSVITCGESETGISCGSRTYARVSPYMEDGAIEFQGARFFGFNHMVVAYPLSTSKVVDGKLVPTPRTTAGVRKALRLPPAPTGDNPYARCWISPYAESSENPKHWNTTCSGYGANDASEDFTFVDEKVHQKFLEGSSQIASMRAENRKREAWVAGLLFVTPLIAYLALTAALVLFARVVRYVVHGRQPELG